jgi:hypothetical protein
VSNPTAVSTSAERELVAILHDPACPWEDRRGEDRAPGGWRRVQVDRLLAFAFVRGADLRGLEGRMDRTVAALGGEREPAAPGSELPFYRLPAASARTAASVSASPARLSSR